MPLPAPLVGLTIRAKLLNADSTAMAGTVTLAPLVPAVSPAGDVLIGTAPLTKTMVDGAVEWTNILATDSPGLSNPVPYQVSITTPGYVSSVVVELLAAQAVGGVLRLDDVAPASDPVSVVTALLASSMGTVGGPGGPIDATGKLPASQIPATGGAATATTTSVGVIQLAGDLAGTATAPTVPALAGAVQSGLLDAKGDLFAGSAPDTVSRLPVGANGQLLTADSTQPAGLRWGDAPAGGSSGARLTLADQMGVVCATQDPTAITSNGVGLGSGTLYGCSAILPAGRSLSSVLVALRATGAAPSGVSKLGVLSAGGVRLGVSADIPTLWTTGAQTAREAALLALVAADPDDDRLISLVMLSTCATPPEVYLGQLLTASIINPAPGTALRSWALTGQTDIPASVDMDAVILNSGVFQLYGR